MRKTTKVFLPPPLNPILEASLSVRKQELMDSFTAFRKDNCDSKGRQTNSLTRDQANGLKSLKKRSGDGELVVLETDKTGKFCSVSTEKFLEMGSKHTKDDKVIDQADLENIQRSKCTCLPVG